MPEIIIKNVQFEREVWKKLKEYSASSEVRRAPGIQAGMIIKEYLENLEKLEELYKVEIDEKN